MRTDHTHAWYVSVNLLLALPGQDGYADRLVCFACQACPREIVTTGAYHSQGALVYPDRVDAVQAQQRRTALGRLAQREERTRLR